MIIRNSYRSSVNEAKGLTLIYTDQCWGKILLKSYELQYLTKKKQKKTYHQN